LLDRKRALAGEVEGLYNRKEKEMVKRGKQSVKNGGLSKVVRMHMGLGVDWEVGREEQEGLAVGELGRRMVVEEWSMGGEALVKERRATGRESTIFEWVSNNSVAPELTQIQHFPSYSD